MKLDFVEIFGFRGFRDKVRVTFGSGFTVINGRNGVGKSTLFDAVKYALTGLIDKYPVEKVAQKSLSDLSVVKRREKGGRPTLCHRLVQGRCRRGLHDHSIIRDAWIARAQSAVRVQQWTA